MKTIGRYKKIGAGMLALLMFTLALGGCQNASKQDKPAETGEEASTQISETEQKEEEAAELPQEPVEPSGEQVAVRVAALKGPTGMGLVGLMDASEKGETAQSYEVTLAASPDEVSPKVITGEVDIAAVPANLGAVLYERTDSGVTFLGINTLGVLYVLSSDETVQTVEDLAGRELYATGQGATPEYTIQHILEQNGLDTRVTFLSEHAELATMMLSGEVEVAVLPEPFVTNVTGKDETIRIALDLTEEWEKVTGGAALPTGGILVRNEFLEANPEAVRIFLEEYRTSAAFVNDSPAEAAALIGKYEIAPEDVALSAIPRCNIVCLTGEEMRDSVQAYYEILFQANPKAVGERLPDEEFYYLG